MKITIFNMIFIGLFVVFSVLIIKPTDAFAVEDELVPMDLDDTEWAVEMIYVTDKGKKIASEDVLIFKEKQFISKSFEDDDYSLTNYSLTAQEDGTTKFGTMQVKGKETSFWKGVVKGNTINGSVHTQYSNGTNRTTYFNGNLTSGKPVPKGTKKVAPPPPAPEPVAEAPAATIEKAGDVASESVKVEQTDKSAAQ